MTADPRNLAAVEDALDVLLGEIIIRRRRQAIVAGAVGGPHRVRLLDPREWQGCPIPTRHESAVLRIISDPIQGAMLFAVRTLGEWIFERAGSTDAMREMFKRVTVRDPDSEGRRAAILDSAWHEVGDKADRWTA